MAPCPDSKRVACTVSMFLLLVLSRSPGCVFFNVSDWPNVWPCWPLTPGTLAKAASATSVQEMPSGNTEGWMFSEALCAFEKFCSIKINKYNSAAQLHTCE